jgi:hypothetical protein
MGCRCRYTGPLDLPVLSLLYFSYLGGVAQLARALAWHARGQGFNSPHLHESFLNDKPIHGKKN